MIVTASAGDKGPVKDNVLAALAYITFIPAIFFLLREPFRSNPFIRFHSMQSIFLAVPAVIVGIALKVLFYVFGIIPWLGHLLALLTALVVSIGWIILWLVAVVKALQGERFHLPVIGDLAEGA
jgi:uncharacterized membrane protein